MRRWFAAVLLVVLAAAAHGARAADDASAGYETVRPSLVKVWAFDRSGRPTQSGTGVIVDSSEHRSLVLTASHVVTGAASIRIDVSRALHDVAARVDRTGPRDLTLLSIDRGGLRAARFAPRSRPVVEGNVVAVAGYVKNDELIGVVGQTPRVLFPGTISSRPENGLYLELENVHIEEGLSGGAVFDAATGEILGIVTSRTSDRRGGFADSAAQVVVPFLKANDVAAATARVAPAAASAPLRVEPPPTQPLPVPLPAEPLPAVVRSLPVAVAEPAPPAADASVTSWQAAAVQAKQFAYQRDGCRIVVTVEVRSLQFVVAHQGLAQPQHRGAVLGITLQERPTASDACADVADDAPTAGSYDATAMSYDGHHVTMRFVYSGDRAEDDRFPSDVSLDADLDGAGADATLQFFGGDWNGSFALPLARTPLASVSSTL